MQTKGVRQLSETGRETDERDTHRGRGKGVGVCASLRVSLSEWVYVREGVSESGCK